MSLFPEGTDAKDEAIIPCIRTPIGSLCVSVHTPIGNLLHDNSVVVRTLPSGAFVYASLNRHVEVEVLLIELPLTDPRFGVLDGCEAAVIRLRALESIGNLSIACQWKQMPVEASVGPESGERLDAQTWETSTACVTIGTQDGEALAGRAKRGNRLPTRLQPVFAIDTVEYLANGLAVPIPDLEPGELCQVHFVVAWSPRRVANDMSTWLAVDQAPEFILKHAACE